MNVQAYPVFKWSMYGRIKEFLGERDAEQLVLTVTGIKLDSKYRTNVLDSKSRQC